MIIILCFDYGDRLSVVEVILLMFVKNFFLEVAQKKGRTK